jgi:NAD(P)-dependent dehydrogenase (short-subunit alcohol dehydrogenase family)
MMNKLAGKVAVITGGNSGIGFATAQAFVREGANVVIFGRSAQTLNEAIEQLGDRAIAVQGNVTAPESLDLLFQTTQAHFGKIDILFVNAGTAQFAPIEAITETIFDQVFNVNFKGAYFTVQKALPYFNPNGTIIFNTSISNVQGSPGSSVYSATKAALRSLVRSLAAELSDLGIRVNAVSPGAIVTPIWQRVGFSEAEIEGFTTMFESQVPLKRLGQPEEVANAVVFLASSDSSYIQGIELVVDGGYSQI